MARRRGQRQEKSFATLGFLLALLATLLIIWWFSK